MVALSPQILKPVFHKTPVIPAPLPWVAPPAAPAPAPAAGGGDSGGGSAPAADSPTDDQLLDEATLAGIDYDEGADDAQAIMESDIEKDADLQNFFGKHRRKKHNKLRRHENFNEKDEKGEKGNNIIDDIVTMILDFIRGLKNKQKSGEPLTPEEAKMLAASTLASDNLIKAGMAVNPPGYAEGVGGRGKFASFILSGKGLAIMVGTIGLVVLLIVASSGKKAA
jgi:hypothetical protein